MPTKNLVSYFIIRGFSFSQNHFQWEIALGKTVKQHTHKPFIHTASCSLYSFAILKNLSLTITQWGKQNRTAILIYLPEEETKAQKSYYLKSENLKVQLPA
jgi:hypothetical protein